MTDHYIRVFNLPPDTKEDTLTMLIKEIAQVDNKVLLAKKNDEIVGWCWVRFHTQEDADTARQVLDGYIWNNTMLYAMH